MDIIDSVCKTLGINHADPDEPKPKQATSSAMFGASLANQNAFLNGKLEDGKGGYVVSTKDDLTKCPQDLELTISEDENL